MQEQLAEVQCRCCSSASLGLQSTPEYDTVILYTAMDMKMSFMLNGESFVLEVVPEMTGLELKQQVKKQQSWDKEATVLTELLIGEGKFLENDKTVADAGLSPDSHVTVIFKENIARCSDQHELAGCEIDLESLIALEIPTNVTEITAGAFQMCRMLAKLTIPDSVTHVGDYAFAACSSLVSMSIPQSVTHIGRSAFECCSSLASVTIPNSLTHIGDNAFGYCSSLASLAIPDSVTDIGHSAFQHCFSLASMSIPNSVLRIKNCTFYGCSSLASVTNTDSVTHIGQSAFAYCNCLASVTIPDSVTHISDYAFASCRSLARVTIPNSVTHFGRRPFKDCSALSSVTIPDSALHIRACAINFCCYWMLRAIVYLDIFQIIKKPSSLAVLTGRYTGSEEAFRRHLGIPESAMLIDRGVFDRQKWGCCRRQRENYKTR